jgi:hypothetical protein
MALKILTKDEKPEPPKLPEGGDRFIWTEVPVKQPEYANILKGKKTTP